MKGKDLGKTATGIKPNVAALLSYLFGFITGIIFYVIEKDNKFVRFHAMQSIIVFGGLFVAALIFGAIPGLGAIILPILWIANIILWVILIVKAYLGEDFKVIIAGKIADKYK
ncbi:MAG: hypothetical protein DRZ76_00230 [Candidatus Nealsonbacteria bacterium]|nr:MAG: hypothetical protein DRZ76_00230 [Candidatus Nealsonbacteria bacterium]